MVKKSGDIKGGIIKPKKAKPLPSAPKHATTGPDSKSKTDAGTKHSKDAIKKGAATVSEAAKAEPSKKSKSSLEIDGLFGQLKSATAAAATKNKTDKASEKESAPTHPKRPKVQGSKDDIFGTEVGQNRKKTEEGYAIYTEDELGFGKKGGGDTDKCPFDCDCCF